MFKTPIYFSIYILYKLMNSNNNEKYLINLFINYYDEMKIDDNLLSNYNWDNISIVFNNLYDKLHTAIIIDDFVKNYYLFTLYYVYYTNFLRYSEHKDYGLHKMYNYFNKIKYDENIIMYMMKNIHDERIESIFKTCNPFIIKKTKLLNYEIANSNLLDYLQNVKKLDKLYFEDNHNCKKLLGIILHRYILSKNINETNFNNFFFK